MASCSAARFPSISTSEINNLAEKSRNASTNKSTRFWVNVFQTWAKVRNKEEDLEKYEYARLDLTLCQFFGEARKQNGEEYEPDGL